MSAIVMHPGGGRILPDLTEVPAANEPERSRRVAAVDLARLRALFAKGLNDRAMADSLGCTPMTVGRLRRTMKLLRHKRSDREQLPPSGPTPQNGRSRHASRSLDDRVARMPSVNHPALAGARTLYPGSVAPVATLDRTLVSGHNSWKIGDRITKGRWRGFPVYTLTLQERATCPTSCAHWRSCTGNHMPWAKRIVHGPALEERLVVDVGLLSRRHPGGFAIRLHVLGDFYSVGYVELWRGLVVRFPALHVFGFTARIDRHDPITKALVALVTDHGPRFAIRFSNAPIDSHATVSIEHPVQKPADAIVCPQQLGRTASCGTCALCWSTDRRIAFLRH